MGGQESKLAFQRGIARLASQPDIPLDDEVWVSLWSVPESCPEVYDFFPPGLIREMRDHAFVNLEKLLLVLTSRLFALKNDKKFPNPETAPASEALNCIRLLTRIIPFLNEKLDLEEWHQKFWWSLRKKRNLPKENSELDLSNFQDDLDFENSISQKNEFSQKSPSVPLSPVSTFPASSISLDASSDVSAADVSVGGSSTIKEIGSIEETFTHEKTLMEELLDTVFRLLFCRGFTLPLSSPEQYAYIIWENGIGTTETQEKTTKELAFNRIEVLRLLLVLISKRLYRSSEVASHTLTYLTCVANKQLILVFLYSLINTTLRLRPDSWKASYSTLVPYNDSSIALSKLTSQILLLFLDHTPHETTVEYFRQRLNLSPGAAIENQYRLYFSRLQLQADYEFLVNELYRLLNAPVSAISAYISIVQKPNIAFPEIILFLWQAILYNKRFRAFLITSPYATEFLTSIQFYALRYREDNEHSGLVRICLFIVHYLSCEKVLCEKLNRNCMNAQSLMSSLGFSVPPMSYAEFLIISSFHISAVKRSPFSSLSPVILLTICNIAPFVENLSFVTCAKLMQLCSSLSSPRFLFRNPRNHLLLEYLLQAISSIVENKFSQNPNLSYSIIRLQQVFLNLNSMKLPAVAQTKSQPLVALNSEGSSDFESKSSDNTSLDGTPLQNTDFKKVATVEDDSPFDELDKFSSPFSSSSSRGGLSHISSRNVSISVPTVLQDVFSDSPLVLSRKLRGKIPENVSSSELIKKCASNPFGKDLEIDSNLFAPSNSWFNSWHSRLELDSILAIISQFSLPVYKKMNEELSTTDEAVKLLANSVLNDVHPRVPNFRYFIWSVPMNNWFQSLVWLYTLSFDEKGLMATPSLFTTSKVYKQHGNIMKVASPENSSNSMENATKSILDKLDLLYLQLPSSVNHDSSLRNK
ncbi:Golgi localized protein, human HID1 ortholog 3, implicated in vesicle-mediated transport [Schizosaccharomyces pombe]|uniref:Ubp5-interacting protein ftp105 n=1 Tax=Schizosaccharomyces pombe (strain 972 / ATCC 24843) TaxID=284812 RepID=FT105_SCHPO|nr:Ubp5 interacting protein Ftp10 [Schizosaccharomyces pombe]O13776.2 RecName: Full=Ubp5-interacting protein ftp105; AltName: Full=Down-regulated in multiple cancers 1 homolog 3; AltName: Full=Hid-1 family protein ftp105 [Schizosaccharomyces pombe 972h-]CAB11516.1 Ubp5 interacting protein Ftp105 [Schizosaccharomyces pombe]|eukprot:NP_593484.1 Ubp5 interacting protein Ftp10 [Schizosaccharomyces pombe]